MKELTEEQIEKAAISIWQISGMGPNQIWRYLGEVYKEAYRERAKLLAQMLQYESTPPQLSGGVVEAMCAEPTEDEIEATWYVQGMLHRHEIGKLLKRFVDYRRASILNPAPPTLEDRVRVISRSGGDRYEVRVDGELKYTFDGNEKADAEIYAAGCIAELTRHTGASHDR